MWPKERRAALRRAFGSFALVLLLGLCTPLAFYTPDRAQTSYCKSSPRTCSDCAQLIYFPLATQTAKYSLRRDGERGQFSTSVTACPELRALHSRGNTGGGSEGQRGLSSSLLCARMGERRTPISVSPSRSLGGSFGTTWGFQPEGQDC